MLLPRPILDRAERVFAYHQASKLSSDSPPSQSFISAPRPSPYCVFADAPKVPLVSSLLDVPVRTMSLLLDGRGAIPDSQLSPPQNLKTLASWLYMAAGLTRKVGTPPATRWLRACPSNGELYPCEIYAAAFGVTDLEPGFYHFSTKEFALRKLRDGSETLARLLRGRPDLEFLRTSVAALFVSTIYCRSTWKYRQRGYRAALLDAGHMTENIVLAGQGLGIETLTRMQLNDQAMNDILGVADTGDFASAESVQSMVVWAEHAAQPIAPAPLEEGASFAPIARAALAKSVTPYGSILAVHEDCVAPGMAAREIRPPLTELSPLSPQFPTFKWDIQRGADESPTLREVLLTRCACEKFEVGTVSRQSMIELNRIAFRGGTFYPLFPDGPHTALVRPFWLFNGIGGIEAGMWYYEPAADALAILRRGDFRLEACAMTLDSESAGKAAAICFFAVNMQTLLLEAGPDSYRLAHLEAGIAAQRLYVGACAMGLGSQMFVEFYDDAVRQVLGIHASGWEILYAVAIGIDSTRPISSSDSADGGLHWKG